MTQTTKAPISTTMATSLVIASTIGTGVFTTLGYQLLHLRSVFLVLLIWAFGGVTAICGSLIYAEIGSALPRSGGEYSVLSKLIHPFVGFLSGWATITVGFASPIAITAMAFAAYLSPFYLGPFPLFVPTLAIISITMIHCLSIKWGELFQNATTILKVLFILFFIIIGFIYGQAPSSLQYFPHQSDLKELFSAPFAISMIYITYAYTGWNASFYIVGDLKNPKRQLPLSLIGGTLLVMALYLLSQWSFLLVAPMDSYAGKIEVALVASQTLFGQTGEQIMGLSIAFLLVSTLSSMIFLGPRIFQVMALDYPKFSFFSKRNIQGIPLNATIFQTLLSLIFLWTSTFEEILLYTSFGLIFISLLTILSIVIIRKNYPQLIQFKSPAYPIPLLIYLTLNGSALIYVGLNRTMESLMGLGIFVIGGLLYWYSKKN